MKKYHATILVIEDNPDDQFLIERAFRKIGVTEPIQTVSNGGEAIAYMKGEGQFADRKTYAYPTFILTDLNMPERDGFAVLEFLKSKPEWRVIPTIVLSASSDPDDIKRAYFLGACSYHVKPSSQKELEHQLTVINSYWMTCEVPEVDVTGKQLPTRRRGTLRDFSEPE